MTDIVTEQILGGLKDLFGNEELSDRMLHIVEADEAKYLQQRSTSSRYTIYYTKELASCYIASAKLASSLISVYAVSYSIIQ